MSAPFEAVDALDFPPAPVTKVRKPVGALFIDQFMVSQNLMNKLTAVSSIDSVNNPSDHVAVLCGFKSDVAHNTFEDIQQFDDSPAWHLANDRDIELYKASVDNNLLSIPLPLNIINCSDVMCKDHTSDIVEFHDKIVKALELACEETIPRKKPPSESKKICGWNEHVENHFRNSLYWHKVWVENGRPSDGIYANIRRISRAEYHKARKYALKNEDLLKSQKIADSLVNDTNSDFWQNIRKFKPKKKRLPKMVDEAQDPKKYCRLI